jgi:hypothetical protein
LKRILLILLAILILTISSYLGYLTLTYIDRQIEEGSAYGFQIGDSKLITYQKAKKVFAGKKIFILYPLDKNEFGPHKEFNFSDDKYVLIADRERWEFLFGEGYWDFLELTFQDDELKTIYRHRQKFELP